MAWQGIILLFFMRTYAYAYLVIYGYMLKVFACIKMHSTTYDSCWFVCGRIKVKISTLYAIKCQACYIANTVQWLKNTVQLF